MKYARISKSNIKGTVNIPSAKAYAHRYILASFLSKGKISLDGYFEGDDISRTLDAIKVLGAKVLEKSEKHNNIIVDSGSLIDLNKIYEICIGESGSTLRFLLPICAAIGAHVRISGIGNIVNRPIGELVTVLEQNGVHFISKKFPLEMEGQLHGGIFKINPEASSQYITGLLFALPLLKEESKILLDGKVTSTPYINMTLDVLKEFSINVLKTDYGYYIKGGMEYIPKKELVIESDWSSAGFFAVLGALKGDITLVGLKDNSLQGDMAIVGLLRQMGANIDYIDGKYIFKKSLLHCIDIDITNIPDMAPLLAICFVCAKGEGKLFGVNRLKIKESDRLQAIVDILDTIHAKYEYYSDDNGILIIKGRSYNNIENLEFKGYNDHRIVMGQTVLSLILDIETKIKYAQSINKSFPSFFNILNDLGAKIEVKDE